MATVLVVALVVTLAIRRHLIRKQIRAELVYVTAQGQPATLQEIEAAERKRITNTAALDLQVLFGKLAASTNLNTSSILQEWEETQNLSATNKFKLASHVERNQAALALLPDVLTNNSATFRLMWTDGPAMLLRHLSKERDVAVLLASDTCLALDEGDRDRAVLRAGQLLRFLELIEQEPILVSQRVRFSLLRMECDLIQAIADRFEVPAAPSESLQLGLLGSIRHELLKRAFISERAFGLDFYQNAPRHFSLNTAAATFYATLRKAGTFDRDELFYLRKLRQVVDSSDRDFLESYATAKAVQAEVIAHSGSEDVWSGEIPDIRQLSKLSSWVLPDFENMFEIYGVTIAQARLAAISLALNRYLAGHGDFPKSLEVLSLPESRVTDPFSGRPFLYRVNSNSVTIYSVGPDQQDNGGTPGKKSLAERGKAIPGTDLPVELHLKGRQVPAPNP